MSLSPAEIPLSRCWVLMEEPASSIARRMNPMVEYSKVTCQTGNPDSSPSTMSPLTEVFSSPRVK
jgi:hypothetical protein